MDGMIDQTIGELMGCCSAEELQDTLAKLSGNFNFSCFSYVDVRHLSTGGEVVPYHLTTVRSDFIQSYIEQGMIGHDPVVSRAASSNIQFTWSDCPELVKHQTPRRGVKGRVRRLVELAHDFGFRQGLVVPCHAVDAQGRPASAFISLYWPDDPQRLTQPGVVPVWFRLALSVFHERMLALRASHVRAEAAVPVLTDRERECLAWASRGKTGGETADILHIGERTVEYHLTNAMRKLGVYNKYHAVAVSIHLGLVVP